MIKEGRREYGGGRAELKRVFCSICSGWKNTSKKRFSGEGKGGGEDPKEAFGG